MSAELKAIFKEAVNNIDISKFPIEISLRVDDTAVYVRLDGLNCKYASKGFSFEMRRAFIVTQDMSEAVKFVYWCIQEAVLHEVAECFLSEGERICDPHIAKPDDKQGNIMGAPDKSWKERQIEIAY
jgi:hypothetical protein